LTFEVEIAEDRVIIDEFGEADFARHDITLLLKEPPPAWPWDVP